VTDKNNMIRQVEELLGSEGTHEDAVRMFDALRTAGTITFDATSGFEMAEVDEVDWQRLLARVNAIGFDAEVRARKRCARGRAPDQRKRSVARHQRAGEN
jgi:hypothetical protein